jgi:hypothetical protein
VSRLREEFLAQPTNTRLAWHQKLLQFKSVKSEEESFVTFRRGLSQNSDWFPILELEIKFMASNC